MQSSNVAMAEDTHKQRASSIKPLLITLIILNFILIVLASWIVVKAMAGSAPSKNANSYGVAQEERLAESRDRLIKNGTSPQKIKVLEIEAEIEVLQEELQKAERDLVASGTGSHK